MSKNCIKIGEWNKQYKYLILTIIFSILKDFALGTSNEVTFQEIKALDGGEISKCFLVREALCYLFTILLSLILHKIYLEKSGIDDFNQSSRNLDENLIGKKASNEIELIHNELEIINYSNYKLLIIIILWVLGEELLAYFKNIFLQLDFWMLELIIIHFFMKKILKMRAYKHQRFMLFFCGIPFILKVITIILIFFDEDYKNEKHKYKYSEKIDKLKIIYVAIEWLLPIGFFIYLILITLRSYINTKIKWLIDLRYISSSKIFVLYSFIGFLVCSSLSIIVSFIPCSDDMSSNYTIYDYFCTVKYENKKYIDNIFLYFHNFDEVENHESSHFEIAGLFLGMAFFGLYKFFSLKVIELLTPIHLIFSFPIYYVFNKIYLFTLNYIKTGSCFLKGIKPALIKIILDFCSDFFSIIGYLIYLEIIELHFCKFDYNIRRNILERGVLEVDEVELNKSLKSQTESDFEIRSGTQSYSEEQKSVSERDFSNES